MSAPEGLLASLGARGLTLGVAESLTGGDLVSAFIGVPGASSVVRGGVVAYASDVKTSVLGVDGDLLARSGAVDPLVAEQMAEGVRVLVGADVGLATTGVAGPEPQDGKPVGLVYIGLASAAGAQSRELRLGGGRAEVRAGTVREVLEFLETWLSVTPP